MPPSKLAHLVFQTNRLPAMRDWYCAVLDGHVIYENPQLCFVTYDDEHHRVAFIDFGPLATRDLAGGDLRYRATDLLADIGTQNIRATVFIECHTHYRTDKPDAFKSVGDSSKRARMASSFGPGSVHQVRSKSRMERSRSESPICAQPCHPRADGSSIPLSGTREGAGSIRTVPPFSCLGAQVKSVTHAVGVHSPGGRRGRGPRESAAGCGDSGCDK